MTYPRRALVCTETTPYYHVYSRCVRRAFLCGVDNLTEKDYSYRKEWIVQQLASLTDVFAIKLAGVPSPVTVWGEKLDQCRCLKSLLLVGIKRR